MRTPTFFKIVALMMTISLATTSYSQAIWNGANSTDWSENSSLSNPRFSKWISYAKFV